MKSSHKISLKISDEQQIKGKSDNFFHAGFTLCRALACEFY